MCKYNLNFFRNYSYQYHVNGLKNIILSYLFMDCHAHAVLHGKLYENLSIHRCMIFFSVKFSLKHNQIQKRKTHVRFQCFHSRFMFFVRFNTRKWFHQRVSNNDEAVLADVSTLRRLFRI